jgi:hypothetical protein
MPMRFVVSAAGRLVAGAALLLTGAAGCGSGPYPVRGTVTLEDGTKVTSGTVIFETRDAEKPVAARGEIKPDGSYELGTHKPGDGAPAGVYRVLIAPPPTHPDRPPEKPPYDNRYTSFATSQLEFEVKAGANEYPIRLAPRPK